MTLEEQIAEAFKSIRGKKRSECDPRDLKRFNDLLNQRPQGVFQKALPAGHHKAQAVGLSHNLSTRYGRWLNELAGLHPENYQRIIADNRKRADALAAKRKKAHDKNEGAL